ncbi:GPI inositol-deacylase [Amycolatopsis sp. EV170708-02-1]|uniref:GPI inositol-deacylase n=1 Tax=Amycolatopsis sp. EV170708-02-1 TaxID=2919322 RepID=UPI001F0C6FAC|nr:GPI inositol-deacylase [Amycolatopsis sp. EV170708-02-1]UMP00088.1 GPI inositol-deacylase [Amycolatopsis sp. EV170708-02-1]
MTRIVGVHGIGNHESGLTADQAAALVSRRWLAAMRRRLGGNVGLDLRVAYYADRLDRGTAQGAVDDLETLTEPERELLLAWAGQLGAPAEVAQGRLTAPARVAASWIAQKFGLDSRMVRIFVSRFCREVSTYFEEPERRDAARGRVTGLLTDARPKVVIGHSLGSVLAYEALWRLPDLDVELLVTLGSPLGLPDVIFDRLDPVPDNGQGSRPPGVRRWINVADSGDIVAVPHGLPERFTGIAADLTDQIGLFDFHKVTNYLASPVTSAAIASLAEEA